MWMLSLISWIHFIRLDWLFCFYQFNKLPHELVKNIQLCVGGHNFRNTNIPSTYSCLVSSFQNHFRDIFKIIVEWWTDQVSNPVQTVKYRFCWTLSNWKGTWCDLCFLIWLGWHEIFFWTGRVAWIHYCIGERIVRVWWSGRKCEITLLPMVQLHQ